MWPSLVSLLFFFSSMQTVGDSLLCWFISHHYFFICFLIQEIIWNPFSINVSRPYSLFFGSYNFIFIWMESLDAATCVNFFLMEFISYYSLSWIWILSSNLWNFFSLILLFLIKYFILVLITIDFFFLVFKFWYDHRFLNGYFLCYLNVAINE